MRPSRRRDANGTASSRSSWAAATAASRSSCAALTAASRSARESRTHSSTAANFSCASLTTSLDLASAAATVARCRKQDEVQRAASACATSRAASAPSARAVAELAVASAAAHDHGHGLARRLVAGVWSFPPSPEKTYENKRNSGNAKRIDAVIFYCRRSRTNTDLTCTRIRALGQRRDKEIPKTPTTSSRATRRFEPWSGARRPVDTSSRRGG